MGKVIGAISILDNASVVLRGIKAEQSAFRRDVKKTRDALKETFDKKRKAHLNAAPAMAKIQALKAHLKPLRKKLVTAVALKDLATDRLRNIAQRIRKVGGMAARPLVQVVRKGGEVLSGIGGKLKSLAAGVVIPVAIAGGAALTAAIGGAVSEGAKLEQSIGGVETLFKDSAGTVKENAMRAFQSVGISANEYMEQVTSFSAALLSSLGGDTEKSAQAADMAMRDMADNANKFGTDMGSIQNAYQGFAKQNYTMLDNLKLGYGGTKEEMQRLLQDAEKLSGEKYDIQNLSDVYHAIHTIQENLNVTGTTAKEASRTFSGSFAGMKAAAKNLLGNLTTGEGVTESMEALVESTSTFLFGNAVPMIGRVIASLPKAIQAGLRSAAPRIRESGGEIVKNLKEGILAVLPSSMGTAFRSAFDAVSTIGEGFSSVLPELSAFGSSVIDTLSQVVSASMPVLESLMQAVQDLLPVLLPALSSVVSSIGDVLVAASPVIAGLIQGISTAVSALAPVFTTIFNGISAKVSAVLNVVGSQMGAFQGIIQTAAPLIASILSTAWGVVSPIMDLCISVFNLVYSTVARVFPGILSIIQRVWNIVKPLIEGIGKAIGKVAELVGSAAATVAGGGQASGHVGKNAAGDNHWKGGLTWVGEKGPELVDLPRGSRILPNKESVSLASSGSIVEQKLISITENQIHPNMPDAPVTTILKNIDNGLQDFSKRTEASPTGQKTEERENKEASSFSSLKVEILKFADQITIRKEEDLDELADKVADRFREVLINMP